MKAEKAVSELTARDLITEDGLVVLFQKFDRAITTEKIDEAYSVYSNFIKFQKVEEMSMNDYIIEYEHFYHIMTQYDTKLQNTVLTFKLADGANICEDQYKLALALGTNLQFEIMNSAFKYYFTKSAVSNEFSVK